MKERKMRATTDVVLVTHKLRHASLPVFLCVSCWCLVVFIPIGGLSIIALGKTSSYMGMSFWKIRWLLSLR